MLRKGSTRYFQYWPYGKWFPNALDSLSQCGRIQRERNAYKHFRVEHSRTKLRTHKQAQQHIHRHA